MASRPLRTGLTLFMIALGVAMFVAVTTTNATIDASLDETARRLVGRADVVVRSFSDQGFSRATVDQLAALPEVQAAAPLVRKRIFYRAPTSQGFVELVGVDPTVARQTDYFGVREGVFLPDESLRSTMVLAGWAKARGLALGDYVELMSYEGLQRFQIVALLDDAGIGETGYGQIVYVPLRAAQTLFNLADRVDSVALRLTSPDQIPALESRLRGLMTQDYLVAPTVERARGLRESVAALQYSLGLFGVLPLVAAAFYILNGFQLSVAERLRELALLRVAGATPGQTLRLVLWEAWWLGLVGSAFGLLLGLALAVALVLLLDARGEVRVLVWDLPARQVVLAFLVGILVTVLAAMLPARKAALVTPLEALRPRGPRGVESGGPWAGLVLATLPLAALLLAVSLGSPDWRPLAPLGLVLLFIGALALMPALIGLLSALLTPLLRLLPGEWLLGMRNLTRNRGRTTVTMTGLVLGIALTVAVGGLAESAAAVGRDRADALFASRHAVIAPVAQPLTIAGDFAALPGVARVSPVRRFQGLREREIVDLVALEPDAYLAGGSLARASDAWRAGLNALQDRSGILLPRALAQDWGVGTGDEARLRANGREIALPVVGVIEPIFPSDDDRGAAIVPWAVMESWTGQRDFHYLNVLGQPGTSEGLLEATLADAAALYGLQAVTTGQIAGSIQRSVGSVLGLINALLAVGILLAVLAVLNTMLLNVYDRLREIGVLRATGMEASQTGRMVLLEALAMGFLALVVGGLLGLGLGWLVLQLARSPEFPAPYVLPLRALLGAVIVALGLVPIASSYPAWRAARLNVVHALTHLR